MTQQGLGILPGRVVRFENVYAQAAATTYADEPGDTEFGAETPLLKVPHMGWNTHRRGSPVAQRRRRRQAR